MLAFVVGATFVVPLFTGAALATPLNGASPSPTTLPLPAPAAARPLNAAQVLPGQTAPTQFSTESAMPLTPDGPSVEAASPQDAVHKIIAASQPRDNQDGASPFAPPSGPTPLADTDNNDINFARWLNGSYQHLAESVDGANVGGFQRRDIDWWAWNMGNVSAGTADVMEFDMQKEPGETLFIEVRVYPTFDYDNYGSPSTYYTVFFDNMNNTQGWGTNAHVKVTAFEANTYFLYIRSPLRNGCCMVNYTITNITDYTVSGDSQIDDNSNRTAADVLVPAALPSSQEVEQNSDMVDVFDLTSQFSIVPAAGDSARVWLNVSVDDGRAGTTDFYNQTQSPAVTSDGQTLSVLGLILFYPDVRGIWHSYTDAGIKGDVLSVSGVINGTPVYAALYTYSLINIGGNPVLSSIPGWIAYNITSFSRYEDRAPSFAGSVPNLLMWEDDTASGQNLVDLSPFYTDDHDSGQLHFGMKYNQQPTIVTPSISGSWLSINPIMANWWGNITLQVLGIDKGLDGVALTADDHATSSNFFTVNLRPVNDPPVLTDIGGKSNLGAELAFTVAQGATLAMTPTVTDADAGVTFAFTVDMVPTFFDFYANNGTLVFHPQNADVGVLHLRETVSDGTATDNVSLAITVTNINDNPHFVRVGGVNITDFPHSFAATQGQKFTITMEVDDPDWDLGAAYHDNINYAADRTFFTVTRQSPDYRIASAEFTPTNAQVGLVTVTFSVTDGALGAFDDNVTVSILVANANDAPYLVSLATVQGVYNITGLSNFDLVGLDGATQSHDFTITVRADDIDVARGLGDTLTFTTTVPNAFRVTARADGVTADITVRPVQADAARGFIDFDIIVTDAGTPGLTAMVSIHLAVANVNDPPEWTQVFSENLTEDVAFDVDFTAVDPDGDAVAYSSDAQLFTVDPQTGEVAFTPTNAMIGGTDYTFDVTFTATDTHAARSSMTVHFFVKNVNSPPTNVKINAPLNGSSFSPGEKVTARATADDLDLDDNGHLTFTWLIDGKTVAQGPSALITVENPDPAEKTVTLQLTVEDTAGHTTNQTAQITVKGTPAPPKAPGFEAGFAVAGAAIAAVAAIALRRRKQ
jgi:hypothetical protein